MIPDRRECPALRAPDGSAPARPKQVEEFPRRPGLRRLADARRALVQRGRYPGPCVPPLHIMRVLGDLMRRGIFYNREQLYRRQGVRGILLAQHLAIGAAVMTGDSRAAEQTATEHIDFTYATIEDIRRDEMRMATSLRRIERQDLVADTAPASRRS